MKIEEIEKIHLIVGITGHRDIISEDREMLKGKIRHIFNDLSNNYLNTPILLMTALAEGADRLAAEVAIEEKIDYVAVLPLPEDLYLMDFPDTQEEFSNLLKKSLGYFVIPFEEQELNNMSKYGKERDDKYAKVGAYIVIHSQIVIALWDGKYTCKCGGTSEVVKYCLYGIPEKYIKNKELLFKSDKRFVYHIPTRRATTQNQIDNAEVKYLLPENETKDTYFGKEGILQNFDNFNRYVNSLNVEKINNNQKLLAGETYKKEKFISKLYAESDLLALKFQRNWENYQKLTFMLAGILLITFIIYEFTMQFYILISYFLLFVMLSILFKFKNITRRHHKFFTGYRALSEGLRIQFNIRLAGIYEDVADFYQRKFNEPMRWVREALRSSNLFDPQNTPDYGAIKKYYLEGQREYFHKRIQKYNKMVKNINVVSNIFFAGSVISIILAILFTILKYNNTLSVIVMLIIIFPFFTGLVGTYLARHSTRELLKEYKAMAELFEDAIRKWDKINREQHGIKEYNQREVSKLVIEVGKEALRENSDWLILHSNISEDIPM